MGEVDASIKILGLLKNSQEDITTIDIASRLEMDRHTAATHLAVLKTKGIVEYRSIGKSKVWKLSKSPFISAIKNDEHNKDAIISNFKQILKNVDNRVNIQSSDLSMIWSNKVHTHGKCYESMGMKEKCKNCPIVKTFKTGKSESGFVMIKNKRVKILTQPIKDANNQTVAVVEIVKQ